jgi:uncharacterized protein involved in exopolysaccharide biosynthesis
MEDQSMMLYGGRLQRAPTLRDVTSICFEHWRLFLLLFCPILLGAALSALITPRSYEAETEILVKRERVDPVVSPSIDSSSNRPTWVSEEDLNSEVEILRSRDLLEKVVTTCGLDQRRDNSFWGKFVRELESASSDQRATQFAVPLAVRRLQKNLRVDSIRKTNLIRVSYTSPDPKLAASVLKTLTDLYLVKHLEVERPPGTFLFFQQQASEYWDALKEDEQRLAEFDRAQNTVSAQAEMAGAQQKLAEFQGNLRQTRSDIAATTERVRTLTMQLASMPDRLATQVRTNPLLLLQMKSNLLALQLKRTELADKYAPSHRAVREVESQIEETEAAIADEENSPLHEQTTDRDPTYQWLSEDLAKSTTELASLRARAAALEQQVDAYRADLLTLDKKDRGQQDLIRNAKSEEANYLLYLNKREEARISDALDEKRIVNASIVEKATVPALPSGLGPVLMVFMGLFMASFSGIGAAFARHYISSSFRNPEEVELILGVPLLASFPRDELPQNGAGH